MVWLPIGPSPVSWCDILFVHHLYHGVTSYRSITCVMLVHHLCHGLTSYKSITCEMVWLLISPSPVSRCDFVSEISLANNRDSCHANKQTSSSFRLLKRPAVPSEILPGVPALSDRDSRSLTLRRSSSPVISDPAWSREVRRQSSWTKPLHPHQAFLQ